MVRMHRRRADDAASCAASLRSHQAATVDNHELHLTACQRCTRQSSDGSFATWHETLPIGGFSTPAQKIDSGALGFFGCWHCDLALFVSIMCKTRVRVPVSLPPPSCKPFRSPTGLPRATPPPPLPGADRSWCRLQFQLSEQPGGSTVGIALRNGVLLLRGAAAHIDHVGHPTFTSAIGHRRLKRSTSTHCVMCGGDISGTAPRPVYH